MAHVITRACEGVCDTACVQVCPVDCIATRIPVEEIQAVPPAERPARFAGVQLFIDPEECIDCGACVPVCPVDAIYLDDEVPPELAVDVERNAAFFA